MLKVHLTIIATFSMIGSGKVAYIEATECANPYKLEYPWGGVMPSCRRSVIAILYMAGTV